MSKATLEYILPEEKSEFVLATKGYDLYNILWDFDQWLRSEIKHKDKEYDEVRTKLHEFMNDHNFNFEGVE